jgi:hypothetical protein
MSQLMIFKVNPKKNNLSYRSAGAPVPAERPSAEVGASARHAQAGDGSNNECAEEKNAPAGKKGPLT